MSTIKKNVLIITERFFPEEFGINDLAIAWQAKGYEVAVLTQAPSYPFDKVYEGYKNKLFQREINYPKQPWAEMGKSCMHLNNVLPKSALGENG